MFKTSLDTIGHNLKNLDPFQKTLRLVSQAGYGPGLAHGTHSSVPSHGNCNSPIQWDSYEASNKN